MTDYKQKSQVVMQPVFCRETKNEACVTHFVSLLLQKLLLSYF